MLQLIPLVASFLPHHKQVKPRKMLYLMFLCVLTDNGPGYTGKKFQDFCHQLQVKHITGIPYNPQGQGIIE